MGRDYEETWKLVHVMCPQCGRKHETYSGFYVDLHNREMVGCYDCLNIREMEVSDTSCPNCKNTVTEEEVATFFVDQDDNVIGCDDCILKTNEMDEDLIPAYCIHGYKTYEPIYA